ncbi:MAG: hypothetical protein XD92_1287 [Proteiniphilum acetatigenes]|uniref:TonB C-terminal domain-containing protein n=1 Tax=Proteiniphilum acetatigenes TaxID=294710 RepID=A0A101HH09_9BACT|nr:MAG: hypothetical protein XD92_1287 [Proteiniphilum acetatigenes]
MEITREKIGGIAGTIIFTVLLLLILLFSYFTLTAPPDEMEGIPVMFGSAEEAYGVAEPPMSEPTPLPAQQPEPPVTTPVEQLITQTSEPTIDIEAQREEAERQARLVAEQRTREEAERRRREEEARRREINQQLSGLFGESAESRGNTEGSGTQGVTSGNTTQGSPTGIGGIGSYDLSGRSLGSGGLVQPRYTVNDEGTVVVDITVDPSGNVIRAEIGKGTNTPNATLLNEALRAARSTKFNAITSMNNQKGTITYRFKLK